MTATDPLTVSTMPPWPGNSQSAETVLSESSELCLECGLCCTGAYLSWAPVSEGEIAAFSDTAILPYQHPDLKDDEDPLRIVLPCACHVGGRCSIFPNRPAVCGEYRCNLLKATMNGSIEGQEARRITAQIKAQFEWLRAAAQKLGYFSPTRTSLYSLLREFHRDVNPRMEFAPAYPHEEEFAKKAFEYVQNVDRHLAKTRQLPRIADIVGKLDRPRPGFDVPPAEICRLRLGAEHSLELRNCPELVEPLMRMIKGWDLSKSEFDEHPGRTALRVWKRNGQYYWDMPFPGPSYDEDDDPLVQPIDVLHEIHYNLDDLHILEHPSHFFLHSAAVEINGNIILLLGTHETGKSTLAMALAARGHRVLADDRIAIEVGTGHAVATGSVPILRKPLPSDEGFWPAKRLVKEHRGPEDDSLLYVDLPEELFAPRGYSGPVAAIVTLQRSATPTAKRFEPITVAEALKALVLQYYSKSLRATDALDGMIRIAESAPAYALKFARTNIAVREIEGVVADIARKRDHAATSSALAELDG